MVFLLYMLRSMMTIRPKTLMTGQRRKSADKLDFDNDGQGTDDNGRGDNQCLHELSQNRLCSLPQNKNVLSDSINKAKGLSEHFIQHTEEPICLLKIPMHLNSGTTTIGPHDTCHKYQVYNNLKSKDRYTYEKNIINIPDSSFYLRNTAIISKIGLKGGSPMWGGFGRGEKKIPTPPVAIISTSKIETQIQTDSGKTSVQHSPIQKKESHINKVSILKKKVHAKNNMRTFSSATCPKVKDDCIAVTSTLPGCNQYIIKKDISKSSVRINAEPSVDSPKQRQITIMDYDDDTNTVLSTEISLSSVVPQNDDELEVTDNLSQTDIQEALSSPLESDQISHEFLLFQENMVVDIAGGAQYSDKDDEAEEDYSVVIRSPTTSDDEFIIQNKNKKYDANVVDNELDEMIEHTSDAADEELLQGFDDQNVVIIQRLEKSPEEQISTKEDFEELIDKGSRSKEKMKRDDVSTMHANEQYRQRPNIARNIYSFSHKTNANSTSVASVSSKQGTGTPISPKISLVTKQLLQSIRKDSQRKSSDQHSIILAPTANISSSSSSQKVTSIILTHNSPVKANVLNVAPKLVTTTPAITIVSASTTQIASILPPKFTVPVISASAIRQLPNVKVIDKPSTSLSLTTHDSLLPKKIFADDSVSPDSSSNCEDDKSKNFPDEKLMLNCSDTYSKTAIASIDSNLKDSIKCERNQGHKNFESTIIKEIENKTNIVNSLPKESKITTSPLPKNSPVIIHNTPELKMTAQIIQESQAHVHIPTAESVGPFVDPTDEQTKSVVISIPSPTPSQEQMLDHIAMQALGHQRRDFEAFEDVLDMIENIRAEPEMLEKIKTKPVDVNNSSEAQRSTVSLLETPKVVSSDRKPLFPQLSPLSEPTEVTNNMLNASQQLRTLLSSLQTTSITSPVNVNSNIKSLHQKTVGSLSVSSALTTPRIIHQAKSGPLIANKSNTDSTNSVIVSNIKPKCHNLSSIYDHKNSNITDNVHSKESTVQNKTFGDRPLIEDANQDSPITLRANQSVIKSQTISPGIQISVTSSNKSGTGIDQKNSLTLTAMLQNQPAATPMVKSSADTITAAALLATAVSLPKTGFTTALVQAQPNTSISTNTCSLNQSEPLSNLNKASTIPVSSFSKPTCSSTTHFLHAQLTKVSKVNPSDEKDVENFENKDIKSECEGNKLSSVSSVILNRTEDSQNVLLKKLLQNTACASTKSPPPNQCSVSNVTLSHESPNNDLKSNSPTLSSMLPTIGKFEPQQLMSQAQTLQAKPFPQRFPLRETSFVSNPNNPQNNSFTLPTEELHIDIKKTSTPVKLTTKEELLSPQTPRSSCSQDSSLQTPPLIIKKEPIALIPQNHISFQDFKKEVIDETSQHSEVSDNSRPDVPVKEEIDLMDSNIEKSIDKEELKKQKRRLYQQKRRQNQLLNKEFNQPKKRPRKNSKIDEDYDSYIDGILQQIRQLSPINVCEPLLNRNFGIVPVIGCGDMSKFNSKWFNPKSGGLIGSYGCANINGYSDFYNTEPYGNDEPIPEKPSVSTQRGFYDQEFPLIQFNSVEDKVFDKFCREDTPDTILSCSSPECMQFQPFQKYEGLTLISDEDETEIDKISMCRFSPEIAMIKPIPLRLKPSGLYLRQNIGLEEKENRVNVAINTSANSMYSKPSKISGSVRVTLTLTSSAAENIITVLKDLANILQIPTPSSYQIIDRNKYEHGKKIGMYRTKGKDGKEGASVDIQSILNGAAKFCKHCDVVILKNVIKKRLSELPFLEKESDLLNEGEELYFCSPVCYVQFGVMHRSSSTDEKSMYSYHSTGLQQVGNNGGDNNLKL